MRRAGLLLSITAVVATSTGAAFAGGPLGSQASPTGVEHRNVPVCAAPPEGFAACNAIRHDARKDKGKPLPPPQGDDGGYAPPALRQAYSVPTVSSAATVAVVDAYHLPTALSDVNLYRERWDIPDLNKSGGPTFRQVGQTGGDVPTVDAGWGQEIALDIEMVSAICPTCNILLVEADSASFADLATAVAFAAGEPGVVAISNSYGGSEQPLIDAYDQSDKGIAVVASTGDSGYGVQSPASFPFVTAVGGTSLVRITGGRGFAETAWSGAGSGCSRYVDQPSWQQSLGTNCGRRALADVAAVADPNTGVAVYDSTPYQGTFGWMEFGGTSVAAPIVASLYGLTGGGSVQDTYAAVNADRGLINDITSGSNGRCGKISTLCAARPGWDGPTGLGTPHGTSAF